MECQLCMQVEAFARRKRRRKRRQAKLNQFFGIDFSRDLESPLEETALESKHEEAASALRRVFHNRF
jgi:hypothetical protein